MFGSRGTVGVLCRLASPAQGLGHPWGLTAGCPRCKFWIPSFRHGVQAQRAGDASAVALALFCWSLGPLGGVEMGPRTQDPSPAQPRPLPARCFCRPGCRSSSPSGCRRGGQTCLFLCSGYLGSFAQGRWPPSRASQRRGRASRASLAARGLSFRGLSSFLGFSFRIFSLGGLSSFPGLSFRGFSLGPRSTRGSGSFPAASLVASPGFPGAFSASSLVMGTSGLSSVFPWSVGGPAWGAGGLDGGAQTAGLGCKVRSAGAGAASAHPRRPRLLSPGRGPSTRSRREAYQRRRRLFTGRAPRDPGLRGRWEGSPLPNHGVWGTGWESRSARAPGGVTLPTASLSGP